MVEPILYECYYCEGFATFFRPEYENHILIDHPNKLAYPDYRELDRLGLKEKGKVWERPKPTNAIPDWIEKYQKKEAKAFKKLQKTKWKEGAIKKIAENKQAEQTQEESQA